jgi:methylated-DNA-[protein]-cysteine S-methyltransferase
MPLVYLPLRASPTVREFWVLTLSTARIGVVWYAVLTDKEGGLVACSFSRRRNAAKEAVIKSLPKALRRNIERSPKKLRVINTLHRIYQGKSLHELPSIVFLTRSEFLRGVYETTMKIPRGKVTTYGRLARQAGSRRASRAVGNAMARNPLPLIVPCHRVVPSTLRVGNYGAPGAKKNDGSRIKRGLLMREGVQFDGEKIFQSCVWDPLR